LTSSLTILSRIEAQPKIIMSTTNESKQPEPLEPITIQQQDTLQPEEGFGAWMQALGAFLVYTATWGLLSAYGSYQSHYEHTLPDIATDNIAWVGTVEGVLLIIAGVVTGPIYDRGYIRPLLYVGTFLTVFGVMMLSLCTAYWQIMLAQGWCVGIGSGILYTPSISLVAMAFNKHRALAVCFATSGTAVGGILYPIIFVRLLPSVGFAWATRVLGFITLAELVVALALILPYTKPATKSKTGPPRALFEPRALMEPAFGMFCVALFFMWIAYWVPFFFIPTYAEFGLGATSTWSFYLLVITNAATIPGRLFAVFIISRAGVAGGMFGFAFVSSILLYAWIAVDSLPAFEAWIVLLGLIMAPLAVFYPAILPLLCPSKDVVGTRMGMASAAAALGVVLGAPVSSKLINAEAGEYWKMQVLIGTCMMAGAACQAFVWWSLRSQQRKEKMTVEAS
jgi:MFS family permease